MVRESPFSKELRKGGLDRLYQGKVRDTYTHPTNSDLLLIVATDRVSIFDLVLPAFVEKKGEVLTALTHFWLRGVLSSFPHHLRDSGMLMGNFASIPAQRTSVVKKLQMIPFELIFRGHLGGSVWAAYQDTGMVAGKQLPHGLTKWEKLSAPIFTPSTKAESGHDVNITEDEFLAATGQLGPRVVSMFAKAYALVYEEARKRGILILDTKFEVGVDEHGSPVIADEVLTPDSSRFTTVEDFERAMKEGRDPVFYDKETVRNWGRTVETPKGQGINKLDPEAPEDLAFVASLKVPEEVLSDASSRYLEIFERITGMPLVRYQTERMHE
ncbi:phosphoribosylaminoimidazolesuccinocarboxamide synthase [Patescibacteria group bacterium]|nr:phosphoribosylaminoimidazolesuccinocarboxamide synthase [Patescibacteria group bacterium]